jgi:hypothetical protein
MRRQGGGTAFRATAGLILQGVLCLACSHQVLAQTGTGSTGAAVLQLPGGARAAGMAGAYVAGTDGDAVFYNPAGAAWIRSAAGMSYQRHVDEIGFGTAAAAVDIGPVVMLSFGFLDYGSISEVVPDPLFGDQRGQQTGRSVGAMEIVGKAGVATALPGGRLSAGGSVGVLWVSVAETGRTAALFDAGLHYDAGRGVRLGAAVRNAGSDLQGARLAPAPLPGEFRAGVAYRPLPPGRGLQVSVHADGVAPLNDGTAGVAAGGEIAIPVSSPDITVFVRGGYNGTTGPSGLGRVHLGAGLGQGSFALDYAFQDMDLLGSVHRFGVRWSR